MASSIGSQPATSTPNQQLLMAELLVSLVRRDLQSLLFEAQSTGSVTVGERRIQLWQFALQAAIRQVEQLPMILIFPPPSFAVFANAAVTQLNRALAQINDIPIASLRIFPPQPGQATLSVQTLEALLITLAQAEALLRLAIQNA